MSWLNLLLVFVPVGLGLFLANASPILVFIFNGLAIVPLSSLLTGATEKIASEAGDTIGAFLNISLGNLVELILFIALKHNQIHVVQASILGSMLVNLLPILGTALCVSGYSHNDPVVNATETQLLSCLLFFSVFVFLMPAAFYYTFDDADTTNQAALTMSRASAVMVLVVYALYFAHELRARAITKSYRAAPVDSYDLESLPVSPTLLAQNPVVMDDGATRKAGEIDPCASGPEDDGSQERRTQKPNSNHNLRHTITPPASSYDESSSGLVASRRESVSRNSSSSRLDSRRHLRNLRRPRPTFDDTEDDPVTPEKTVLQRLIPVFILIISSGLMSMCAEFLVGTIDEVTHQGHLSEAVIGLIILPIVGNVAEYVTVVTVASREKLDLALAVAVGSSIQIALCVAPLTVVAGWTMSRDLSLNFNLFEVAALMGTALLVSHLVLSDGNGVLRASGLKGALMCACYVIIGFGAYLSPELED
ncbi:sodium calcium [Colletotrichum plurivorum]|uniref:Sodium calcium n=1 Tax=Colletotrichum plurivorum TaxID=2175906 RepID=A0A8H6K9X4_9PEZI|nr:sodium calcium [Colletotrichum plurivorum]